MFRCKKILLLGLSSLAILLTLGSAIVGEKPIKSVFAYASGDAATYYNSITATEGVPLLDQLQALQKNKLKSRVGYSNMPSKFTLTDPGTNGGVMAFYNGTSKSYSGNMNREHVWPASRTVEGRDVDPLEDDIHMVRPTLISDNNQRGNAFFVENMNVKDASWDPANCGNSSYRGDAARIILYCVVADSRLSLSDNNNEKSSNHSMGKLSDLLKWNLEYPVTQREKTRNEAAQGLQGNRNPFIDHPEYACKIWGKKNENTKAVCSGSTDLIKSISLDKQNMELEIGSSYQLQLTVDPEGMKSQTTFYWGSYDESVATVNNVGLVSGVSNGTTIISVSTADGCHVATCNVKVGTGIKPMPIPSGGGCGGSIATTSVLLSTIAILGIGILLTKKATNHEKEN